MIKDRQVEDWEDCQKLKMSELQTSPLFILQQTESSDETPRGRKKQTVSSADFAFHVMHVFLHVQLICPAEDAPWYQSTDGRLILMTSASVAALLVLLLSMTVFLCRRAKRARTIKGPM